MIVYRGFEYEITKDTYDVYDRGKLTNEKISIASGAGIKNPEERARQRIDEILNILKVDKEG
jgi:hypothetical protein